MRWSDYIINQTNDIKWLSFPLLNSIDFIVHGFIIKNQNSAPHQEGKEIKKLLQGITSSERKLISPRQMHQDECLVITSKDELKTKYRGDAILTNRNDVFISIQVADCVPIFMVNEKRGVIGLIHAGWKGALLGIARKTVEKAKHQFRCKPEDFTIVFGPCIRTCCYKVSDDVAILFDRKCVKRSQNNLPALDLICVNRKQFLNCGVKGERISATNVCTFCDKESFHSYRREKENAGRMIAFLGLK
jgi:YfiH family protein